MYETVIITNYYYTLKYMLLVRYEIVPESRNCGEISLAYDRLYH
jgi:hypothetical protein